MKPRKREKWEILNLWCECGAKFFTVVGDVDSVTIECPNCKTKTELVRKRKENDEC